jgi:fluoroquinolone transport system permease protein
MINSFRAITALGPMDAKSILRDPMLRWFFAFPIAMGLALRWLYPFLVDWMMSLAGFDLRPYNILAASFLLITLPMLTGSVVGFLFLDQRDDQTLRAIQVTPLSLTGYMAYRIALPMLICLAAVFIALPLSNLASFSFLHLLLGGLAAAPMAPIFAFLLASVAENKIQGFAMLKGMGGILMPPLLAYFVTSGWHWAFGIIPTFWPARIFWALTAGEAAAPLIMAAGLGYQMVWVLVLLRRYQKIMER